MSASGSSSPLWHVTSAFIDSREVSKSFSPPHLRPRPGHRDHPRPCPPHLNLKSQGRPLEGHYGHQALMLCSESFRIVGQEVATKSVAVVITRSVSVSSIVGLGEVKPGLDHQLPKVFLLGYSIITEVVEVPISVPLLSEQALA